MSVGVKFGRHVLIFATHGRKANMFTLPAALMVEEFASLFH